MSLTSLDFDSALESGWAQFAHSFAECLCELEPGDQVAISAEATLDAAGDGCHVTARPWLLAQRADDLLELSVPNNRQLHPRFALPRPGMAVLRRCGFSRGHRTYRAVLPLPLEAPPLARLVTAVMRDAFGVLHPCFLGVHDELFDPREVKVHWEPTVNARSKSALEGAIVDALHDIGTPAVPCLVEQEASGDIVVHHEAGDCVVQVSPDLRWVRLSAWLGEVDEHSPALSERLHRLGRVTRGTIMEVVGDQLFALHEVEGEVVALGELRRRVAHLIVLQLNREQVLRHMDGAA